VRSQVITAVKIQVDVFWFVMPRSGAMGYWRFRGPCCVHCTYVRYETRNRGRI